MYRQFEQFVRNIAFELDSMRIKEKDLYTYHAQQADLLNHNAGYLKDSKAYDLITLTYLKILSTMNGTQWCESQWKELSAYTDTARVELR